MIRALAPAVGDIVVTAFADARAIAADALAVQVRAALAEARRPRRTRPRRGHDGGGARDGVAALARHRRRRIDLPARRSVSARRPARPVRGWPIRRGLVRRGELSRMAVLSCGVVPAGSRLARARARRARLPHRGRAARRRPGATAGAPPRRGDRHPSRLRRPPGAPRPAPHPLLGRGRDRAGGAGHPLLGRRRRLLRRPAPPGRRRQRGVRHPVEPHLGRQGRLRHPDAHGDVLQRLRVGVGQRQGRQELLRRPGAGRVLLRRDDREDRRGPVPHPQGRRSRPASSRRRAGKSPPARSR